MEALIWVGVLSLLVMNTEAGMMMECPMMMNDTMSMPMPMHIMSDKAVYNSEMAAALDLEMYAPDMMMMVAPACHMMEHCIPMMMHKDMDMENGMMENGMMKPMEMMENMDMGMMEDKDGMMMMMPNNSKMEMDMMMPGIMYPSMGGMEDEDGMMMMPSLMYMDKNYTLNHIKVIMNDIGSEHMMNEKSYDGEVQFVHYSDKMREMMMMNETMSMEKDIMDMDGMMMMNETMSMENMTHDLVFTISVLLQVSDDVEPNPVVDAMNKMTAMAMMAWDKKAMMTDEENMKKEMTKIMMETEMMTGTDNMTMLEDMMDDMMSKSMGMMDMKDMMGKDMGMEMKKKMMMGMTGMMSFNLTNVFPEQRDYYMYGGSTPDCHLSHNLVFKTPMTMSMMQHHMFMMNNEYGKDNMTMNGTASRTSEESDMPLYTNQVPPTAAPKPNPGPGPGPGPGPTEEEEEYDYGTDNSEDKQTSEAPRNFNIVTGIFLNFCSLLICMYTTKPLSLN